MGSNFSTAKTSGFYQTWRLVDSPRGLHMFHRFNSAHLWIVMLICASTIDSAWAGQSANMPGVENSVGYFASGTSIEPRTTSEAASMLHGQLGNWTLMFHANGFLTNVQQSGPRGGDKVFSLN